jgi:hypothetical protein
MNIKFGKFCQMNEEIVNEAIKQNGLALQFVSEVFRENSSIALKAVRQNGLVVQFIDLKLTKNEEILLAAVEQNGMALIDTKDKEIILTAVK